MFTDEQQAAIDALLAKQAKDIESKLRGEFDESVKGLKSTNEALKAEKLAEKEAREAAELEAARKAEDWEKVHKLETERLNQERELLSGQVESFKSRALNDAKKLAVEKTIKHFVDASIKTQSWLRNDVVGVRLNDDGSVIEEYKDINGNVVANSLDEYLKFASSNEVLRKEIKGSQANGGGAGGSYAHNQHIDYKNMSRTEQTKLANTNPELYKQYFK